MPKSSPLQSNFNGGEFSPLLYGRVDAERYKIGLALCKNYIPTIQGGLIRRPGTVYVAETKTSGNASRLFRFEFSTTQAYAIELGGSYGRFYRDGGQITETPKAITGITNANPAVVTIAGHGWSDGNEVYIGGVGGMSQVNGRNFVIQSVTANTFALYDLGGNAVNSSAYGTYTSGGTAARVYTIATPYNSAHVFDLNTVQSQDVLYITHTAYQPQKLTRTGHASWTMTPISFLDGPYLPQNSTATTFTFGATSGSVTVTASTATFAATDVGRHIRIDTGNGTPGDPGQYKWTWLLITAYTSPTVVTATVKGNALSAATANTKWRLGLWSNTTGWPATVTFHEDRLVFAGSPLAAQRLDMSMTGDYENFSPTAESGLVENNRALSFTLNANDVNVIRWLVSQEKGLIIGTVGGEWAIRPSAAGDALSASNPPTARQVTAFGSANVQPVIPGKTIIFLQRSARKVRELGYYYEEDGYRSPDRTIIAEHITESGIKQMAYQKNPQSIVWCVRNDGVLAGMTYEKDEEGLTVGWHRHIFGGYTDIAGTPAIAESVVCIPSSDGVRDETWMIVKRLMGGRYVRSVEYISRLFDDTVEQKDAYFVDCGLSYDNPLPISNITQFGGAGTVVTVTSTAHGLSDGDSVILSDIVGALNAPFPDGVSELNNQTFVVANKTANTFELLTAQGGATNVSMAGVQYISGGSIRKFITSIGGLWHLEGQYVSVAGDGAVQPSKVVVNGTITLSTRAATVHVGFGYSSEGQMLRLEAGSADGTALGKTRRIHRVGFLFHRSLGLEIGTDFDNLQALTFRTSDDAMTRAPALYSGLRSETLESDYDFEGQLCWRTEQPLPSMILAVAPQMHTEDRG